MMPRLPSPFPAAVIVGLAMLAALALQAAYAQEPRFEIIDVHHDPRGSLLVSLGAADEDFDPRRLTPLINGVPVALEVNEHERRGPASVVLAIDTSGSMAGEPMAAARNAAHRLVDRLHPTDRVAIVAFATAPVTLSGFTTDRATTHAVIDTLFEGGATALYDAVGQSVALLGTEGGDGPRVFVLLSDGEDSVPAGPGRIASIDAVLASGVTVHAFALGTEADPAYLQLLAEAGGGAAWDVPDEQALGELFESLGRRLGAAMLLEIRVPPLPLGEHTLELVGGSANRRLTATERFTVTNEGLLRASVIEPATAGEHLVVRPESSAPLQLLTLEAAAGGTSLRRAAGGDLTLDPWTANPGMYEVSVRAMVAGGLAAETTVALQVPALEPTVTLTDPTNGMLLATARVQGTGQKEIRVFAGDREVARGAAPRLEFAAPGSSALSVAVFGAGGQELARESFTVAVPVEPSGGGLPAAWLLVALLVTAIPAVVVLQLRRRARRAPPPVTPRRPVRRVPGGPAPTPAAPSTNLGTLVLRSPDGEERSVPLQARPLTIGSGRSCDVVLQGAGVRAMHARVMPLPNGEFQVHGIGAPGRLPGVAGVRDEWVVVRSGESLALGDHVITLQVEDPAAQQAATEAAERRRREEVIDRYGGPPAGGYAHVDP